MSDATLSNIPRSGGLGAIADALNWLRTQGNRVDARPTLQAMAGAIPFVGQDLASRLSNDPLPVGNLVFGNSPEEVNNWSYGNYPMRMPELSNIPVMKTGRGPQVADTLFTAQQLSPLARAAMAGVTRGANALGDLAVRGITGSPTATAMDVLNSAPPLSNVVKDVGGQWLSPNDIFDQFKGTMGVAHADDPELLNEMLNNLAPEEVADAQVQLAHDKAVSGWIDGPLKKYVTQRMATPADELRQLADQGITHNQALIDEGPTPADFARYEGLPRTPMGETPLGRAWDLTADYGVNGNTAGHLMTFANRNSVWRNENPWLAKLDPNTPIYGLDSEALYHGGFDHVIDTLKEDLANGRLRPEQLNKVSVADAVRRTAEVDAQRMKAAETASKANLSNSAVSTVREYPDAGMRWVELGGKDEAALSQALKAEGQNMGHCVGGYCPSVLSGGSRIFSLRDAQGNPHVTIEVAPQQVTWGLKDLTPKMIKEFNADPRPYNVEDFLRDNYPDVHKKRAAEKNVGGFTILQIKGKGNAAPVDKYLPQVQDFVKNSPIGRDWGSVGDFKNTGLIRGGETHTLWGGEKYTLPNGYYTPQEAEKLINDGLVKAGAPQSSIDAYINGLGITGFPSKAGYAAGGHVEPLNAQEHYAARRAALVQRHNLGGLNAD